MKAEVVEVVQETPKVRLIYLFLEKPLNYKPGQWVSVWSDDRINENNKPVRRAFSIVSVTDNKLELCIARGKKLSAFLQDLKPGSIVNVAGPFGNFTLQDFDSHLFIAAGTGIAPFHMLIQEALEKNQKATLIFSMKTPADFVYRKKLEAIQNLNFTLVPTVTADSEFLEWKGERGRIQTFLSKYWKKGSACYLCGPSAFTDAIAEELVMLGQPEKDIFVDRWQ